jgi:hypothetical protein
MSPFGALGIALVIVCTAAYLSSVGVIDVKTQVIVTAAAIILQVVLMDLEH